MAERKESEPPRIGFRTTSQRTAFPGLRAVGRRAMPLDDLYHFVLKARWSTFFLLVTAAFTCVNAVFGLVYWCLPGAIANAEPGSYFDAFFFSVQTLATIGYGSMSPQTHLAHVIVGVEALVGIFCTALITGMTFAKFARPTARVLFADNCVIGPRDGVPHLQFRVANWRHNEVAEAHLQAIVLVAERTLEGETTRVPYEIRLVRDRTPIFMMSWTAIHRIDESSPFYGDDAIARLKAKGADIFLSFTGLDETIGQSIHARYRYGLDDIVHNARFDDVLTIEADGTRVVDYRRFHKTIPIPPPETALPTSGAPLRKESSPAHAP